MKLIGGAGGLGWVAVKAVLIFGVAVTGLRLGERRTLAQLGAFDFAVAVAIGSIIGRTVTASSASFVTGAVALVTLLVVHRLVALARRHSRIARIIDHPPRVLVAKGEIQDRELARAGLTVMDLSALLRQQGVDDLGRVGYLLYETRGVTTLIGADDEPGPLLRDGLSAAGYRDVAEPAERHVRQQPRTLPGLWKPIWLDGARWPRSGEGSFLSCPKGRSRERKEEENVKHRIFRRVPASRRGLIAVLAATVAVGTSLAVAAGAGTAASAAPAVRADQGPGESTGLGQLSGLLPRDKLTLPSALQVNLSNETVRLPLYPGIAYAGPAYRTWPSGAPALAAIAGVAALSAFVALRARGTARVIWLAMATAVIYALVDAITKSGVDLLMIRGAGVLATWEPYALIAAGVLGGLFGQSTFNAGPLSLSLPVIDTVEPVCSVILAATPVRSPQD